MESFNADEPSCGWSFLELLATYHGSWVLFLSNLLKSDSTSNSDILNSIQNPSGLTKNIMTFTCRSYLAFFSCLEITKRNVFVIFFQDLHRFLKRKIVDRLYMGAVFAKSEDSACRPVVISILGWTILETVTNNDINLEVGRFLTQAFMEENAIALKAK
ncbi:hypothetical protein RF11_08601 [Thelohanellus kitauei]|uniref:Uncharacterized protein n=1 Tax=Thelohanellus kitauei TaxID=669202 RepID=A0A0C2N4P3_THEKT|nr:hypothetical protein RF11_08601 [Thelohanellus kitauei]